MLLEEVKSVHEEYRKAIEAFRDEATSPEARKQAGEDQIRLRHLLDAENLRYREEKEDAERLMAVEARDRAAAFVAGVRPPEPSPFPLEAIRAYGNSKTHGEKLSFTIPMETRADWTTIDTTTYSSYTVPQSWASDVYMFQLEQSGVLAAGPTILATANGNQINYPKLTTDMTTGTHGEGSAATETNPVFGTTPLNSYRLDGWTPIADELFRDSGVNIESVLRRLAARSLAVKAAPYYGDIDIGTGSSAPAAITVGITNGKTCASQTTPTLDEIKECMMSVIPAYRMRGKFVANTTLTLDVALMKNGDGDYLWQPTNALAEPDRLFGKPWFEDAYFDASASGNIPLIFGAVEDAYIVRRIGGIQVDLSRDFAFTSFETTARWAMWHDAAAIDAIACKALTLA